MFKVLSANFIYALLFFLAVPLVIFMIYLGAAAWTLHQAEKNATEACAMFAPGMSLDAYILQLKKRAYTSILVDDKDGLKFVSTTFKSIAISRFVCVVQAKNNQLQSAEVIYID